MTDPSSRHERKIVAASSTALAGTIVIGLGNPILGDDGLGWRVAQAVQSALQELPAQESDPSNELPVEIDFLSLGGLSLMERMVGYTNAVLIDAITTGQNPQGRVLHFSLDELPPGSPGHMTSAHDTTLKSALELGRRAGVRLPDEIEIVAIESNHVYDFSEELSSPIEAAIPEAVELVLKILGRIESSGTG